MRWDVMGSDGLGRDWKGLYGWHNSKNEFSTKLSVRQERFQEGNISTAGVRSVLNIGAVRTSLKETSVQQE